MSVGEGIGSGIRWCVGSGERGRICAVVGCCVLGITYTTVGAGFPAFSHRVLIEVFPAIDTRARQVASQPQLIKHLINLLDSADPTTQAQQTHALLGLLRNLVLAPGTDVKRTLAPHVVSALGRMDVFNQTRDLVASVQGGAVGLLRLLSRGDGMSPPSDPQTPTDPLGRTHRPHGSGCTGSLETNHGPLDANGRSITQD